MNPFECIEEMKQTLKSEVVSKNIKGSDYISQAQHYQRMMSMLNILEEELKTAEYNYEVESLKHEVKTFSDFTVLQEQLNDDVIVFQPVGNIDEISAMDLNSLADILRKLSDSGQIEENMLIIPPNINIFRAKLARSINEDDEE